MSTDLARFAIVLGLQGKGEPIPSEIDRDALLARTRDQLREAAKKLGLTGVSKLKKEALAERVLEALTDRLRAAAGAPVAAPAEVDARPAQAAPQNGASPTETQLPRAPEPPASPAPGADPAALAKLDLGPAAHLEAKPIEHIPWSYGQERVTAAAVDPAKLFVYWEVTDPAIESARGRLGRGGPGAWLNVRVYDTTGLIFDGTNAHSYFDHRIERHDRQWFFDIGKPSSTAYVELGLKSDEGFFVKIARSGRVDFPRSEPAPWDEPEWMVVRVATGDAAHAGRGAPPPRHEPGGQPPAGGAVSLDELRAAAQDGQVIHVWQLLHGGHERVEWREIAGDGWVELEQRVEWQGPITVSAWEAGPFTYPVGIEPPTRQEWSGRAFTFRVGDVTRVIYGPYQVVIRNLGAHEERRVLSRWEVFRMWAVEGGRERNLGAPGGAALRAGASEALGASELRLGGASEVWRLGASELRFRGASETLFLAASQWMLRGASERRLGGASEVRLAGASERRLGGASERRLGGASERMGASEGRLDAGAGGGAYPSVER